MKVCSKCGESKNLSDFGRYSAVYKNRYRSHCKSCRNAHNRTYYYLNKERIDARNREHSKVYRRKNRDVINEKCRKHQSTVHGHLVVLLGQARRRAKKAKLEFDLDVNFLKYMWDKQKGICVLTGKVMSTEKGKGHIFDSASLDRIDNFSGYAKDNVRFICTIVNKMRANGTDEELYEWCEAILNNR
jgi:hypothetical protein